MRSSMPLARTQGRFFGGVGGGTSKVTSKARERDSDGNKAQTEASETGGDFRNTKTVRVVLTDELE